VIPPSEPRFKAGDLVGIDFGYQLPDTGIFLRYYGPHNGGWECRGWVYVDGERLPIPVTQLRLMHPA